MRELRNSKIKIKSLIYSDIDTNNNILTSFNNKVNCTIYSNEEIAQLSFNF